MEFDSPLGIGARGGHGPVRYTVQDYVPGRKVVFQFALAGLANGLEGRHWFEIVPTPETTVFRHVIDAECGFVMWLKWAFLIRPLHDALLEDAFDKVELDLHGRLQRPSSWSLWVRTLRKLVAGRPVKRT
ncbi:MAG: hypothetical protein HY912_18345 [Desulfomonile tiedjei]|uniref:SRPBCC family protein n=1 Tax=Desulfomonile tiedjei TaxID=2358 RepID=A0A9D6V3Z4_9BACT|nr:hypothetical protein [Desulfomonile tiedjei]